MTLLTTIALTLAFVALALLAGFVTHEALHPVSAIVGGFGGAFCWSILSTTERS